MSFIAMRIIALAPLGVISFGRLLLGLFSKDLEGSAIWRLMNEEHVMRGMLILLKISVGL